MRWVFSRGASQFIVRQGAVQIWGIAPGNAGVSPAIRVAAQRSPKTHPHFEPHPCVGCIPILGQRWSYGDFVPAVAKQASAESEHRLSAITGPTHASLFHALLNHRASGASQIIVRQGASPRLAQLAHLGYTPPGIPPPRARPPYTAIRRSGALWAREAVAHPTFLCQPHPYMAHPITPN